MARYKITPRGGQFIVFKMTRAGDGFAWVQVGRFESRPTAEAFIANEKRKDGEKK